MTFDQKLSELIKKEIPSAEIFDISNAEKISWHFKNCGWNFTKPSKGYVIIVPNPEV